MGYPGKDVDVHLIDTTTPKGILIALSHKEKKIPIFVQLSFFVFKEGHAFLTSRSIRLNRPTTYLVSHLIR